MKRILSLAVLLLMTLSLSACAPGGKKSYQRVKCPACGYEFDTPAQN